MSNVEILVTDQLEPHALARIGQLFTIHHLAEPEGRGAQLAGLAPRVRAIVRGGHSPIDATLIGQLPALEIVANFGVGYDGIDLVTAAARRIVVTNSPDVLTEEVADTALGLLLMTVRELSASERYLRAGRWATEGSYPLSGSLRDRTVGMVGLGRIGLAITRRLDAMQVPVVYHTRAPRPGVPYRHYPALLDMAAEVDTLMVIVPGSAATRHLIDTSVLEALGADGVLINVSRGTVVDETALIEALQSGTILAAGLDVFAHEPRVPAELIALPNTVLLPHVGSASVHTRKAMGQLVVDNVQSWFEHGRPITPVPETPWPRA